MMKKISNGNKLFIGTAEEIAPLYKSIRRAISHANTGLFDPWVEPAKFTPGRYYGVEIAPVYDGPYTGEVSVLGENSLLALLLEGGRCVL